VHGRAGRDDSHGELTFDGGGDEPNGWRAVSGPRHPGGVYASREGALLARRFPRRRSQPGGHRLGARRARVNPLRRIGATDWSKWPELSSDEVVWRMLATARDVGATGYDTRTGWGIVDPVAALSANVSPSPRAAATPMATTDTRNTCPRPEMKPPQSSARRRVAARSRSPVPPSAVPLPIGNREVQTGARQGITNAKVSARELR